MKRSAVYVPIACVIWSTPLFASGNLLVNGGFEVPHACNCHLGPGQDLGGWEIEGGPGYKVTPFWEYPYSREGFQDLYLWPNGHISQLLSLIAGRNYELSGYAGSSWNNGPATLEATVGNRIIGSALVPAPRPPDFGPPFYWYQFEFLFRAASSSEELELRAIGPYVILDDLQLVEVIPEPAPLVLLGLSVVGALGARVQRHFIGRAT
jgi:hypothetical protein